MSRNLSLCKFAKKVVYDRAGLIGIFECARRMSRKKDLEMKEKEKETDVEEKETDLDDDGSTPMVAYSALVRIILKFSCFF